MYYSIIIPHYNIPNLLRRLLDSVPSRNDLEAIIIDDNSDSNAVDFEQFPGLDKNNVKVIFDKKGGGGGYARNIGLKHATQLLGSKFVYENERLRSSNNYKFARSRGTLCVTDERIPSPALINIIFILLLNFLWYNTAINKRFYNDLL